jgi:periplasmic protein TonB
MTPTLHALNIVTLATWLSVAGFGAVGCLVGDSKLRENSAKPALSEPPNFNPEIAIGAETTASSQVPAETEAAETTAAPASPPALPTLSAARDLPEIPNLTLAKPAITRPAAKPAKPAHTAAAMGQKPTTGAAISEKPGTRQAAPSGGAAAGLSNTARLAAGRMPSPNYPAEARRKSQVGTVIVEFTVDAGGQVISAYAKSPSAWPLLNEEAVRAVRRWKFPPGNMMKLQRPIVFKLR